MKKIVIVLSIIALMVIVFNLKEEQTFKINGTTYALSIDGKAVDEIPLSGTYYLNSYSCKNGSIITWDSTNHDLYIKGTKANADSCMLDFSAKQYLNTMKVGDYVAYVGDSSNGCLLNGSGTTGTSNAEAGNSCKGENANQSIDTRGTYGYCYDSYYRYYVYGWRIAYIENGNVYLISAGAPECKTRTESTANKNQIAELNQAALKYCNATYADGGSCSSSNTWAMGNEDFKKITYEISGTKSNLWSNYGTPYCHGVSSKTSCGYGNDLIDNGGSYWFAAYPYLDKTYGIYWNPFERYVNFTSNLFAYGFRPVIRLSSSVYVTSGTGTMENPYEIEI